MTKRTQRIIIFSLIFVIAIGFFYFVKPYRKGIWSQPLDGNMRIHQFAKYDTLSAYEYQDYRHSRTNRNKIAFLENKKTHQYFTIFILREIEKVNFENIEFSTEPAKQTQKAHIYELYHELPFHLETYLPLFVPNEDFCGEAHLTIRSFDLKKKDTLSTLRTDILLAEGEFDSLGFYRKQTHWLKPYTVPVIVSDNKFEGAIAIINNKATGDTIFAVGSVLKGQPFNLEEFKEIVKSIHFTPQPGGINMGYGYKSYSWD